MKNKKDFKKNNQNWNSKIITEHQKDCRKKKK